MLDFWKSGHLIIIIIVIVVMAALLRPFLLPPWEVPISTSSLPARSRPIRELSRINLCRLPNRAVRLLGVLAFNKKARVAAKVEAGEVVADAASSVLGRFPNRTTLETLSTSLALESFGRLAGPRRRPSQSRKTISRSHCWREGELDICKQRQAKKKEESIHFLPNETLYILIVIAFMAACSPGRVALNFTLVSSVGLPCDGALPGCVHVSF